MSERDIFDRIVASLHEAALDDTHWAGASALIDEALRTKGSGLVFGAGGPGEKVQIFFARFFHRGRRQAELEREYYKVYYPVDERVPRIRQLPDSRLVSVRDLYTDEERKTSATYNEMLARAHVQRGLNVRLDGPNGSRVVWRISDPVASDGWTSRQIESVCRLLPHIRHCVAVRRRLDGAGALGSSLDSLLATTGCGIVQLDWRGRILEANDRARELLRTGDGLCDEDGFLFARSPDDDFDLQRLLTRALPPFGAQGVAGSTTVGRSAGQPPLGLHVSPVASRETESCAWPVSALVVVDPGSDAGIDPGVVAESLGLTAAESRVAVLLAEGKTVREVASETGCTVSTIRTHVRHIFDKHGIRRQVDLVRLVLSTANTPRPRR